MGQTSLIGACTQGRPDQHPFSILAILFLPAETKACAGKIRRLGWHSALEGTAEHQQLQKQP